MPRPRLEVFGTEAQDAATVVTDLGAMEEVRLAAYEQGYAAGWDDATAAQADDQTRLRADIARNLQGLAFTYQESRAHVLKAVAPLLTEMTARILPAMARDVLPRLVAETLAPFVEAMAQAPMRLTINPAARPAVEAVLTDGQGLNVQIVEEPTLGEGQAYLQLGEIEQKIDLDQAVADIAAAVNAFFDQAERDPQDG